MHYPSLPPPKPGLLVCVHGKRMKFHPTEYNSWLISQHTWHNMLGEWFALSAFILYKHVLFECFVIQLYFTCNDQIIIVLVSWEMFGFGYNVNAKIPLYCTSFEITKLAKMTQHSFSHVSFYIWQEHLKNITNILIKYTSTLNIGWVVLWILAG